MMFAKPSLLLPLIMSSALCVSPASAQEGGTGGGGGGGAGGAAGSGGGGGKRTPTHVACVGDSITAGFGATTKGYVGWLIDMFGKGAMVAGFGHAGSCLTTNCKMPTVPYVTQPEYNQATEWVAAAGGDAVVDVIIMLGTNDSAPQNWPDEGKAPAQYAKDYGELIEHFRALPSHPVIYVVAPPAIYLEDPTMSTNLQTGIIPVIKQVAETRGMPLIDVNTPTLNHPEWSEGLHPNDAGHEVIGKIMYAALLDLPIPTPVPSTTGGAGGASAGGGGSLSGAGNISGGSVGGSSATGGSSAAALSQRSGGCELAGRDSRGLGWLLIAAWGAAALQRRQSRG